MPTKQDGQLSNFHLKRYEISLIPPPMSNYYARFERGAIIDRFFWYETVIFFHLLSPDQFHLTVPPGHNVIADIYRLNGVYPVTLSYNYQTSFTFYQSIEDNINVHPRCIPYLSSPGFFVRLDHDGYEIHPEKKSDDEDGMTGSEWNMWMDNLAKRNELIPHVTNEDQVGRRWKATHRGPITESEISQRLIRRDLYPAHYGRFTSFVIYTDTCDYAKESKHVRSCTDFVNNFPTSGIYRCFIFCGYCQGIPVHQVIGQEDWNTFFFHDIYSGPTTTTSTI